MNYPSKELHFYGHETFPLRHLWLSHAIKHVERHNTLTDYENIMVEYGLGRNMAKSMKHWAESTKIVESSQGQGHHSVRKTQIGELIFSESGDKYLQYSNTIWLLHYLLITNHHKNALWYYLFNFYSSEIFTKESFLNSLTAWLAKNDYPSLPNKKQLERDFNCCMNMYCLNESKRQKNMDEYFTSLFNPLQLISEHRGEYRKRSMTSAELSKELFSYSLLDFLEQNEKKSVVPFTDIQHGEKSPGKVFNMSENTLVEYLEKFVSMNKGVFEFESTAGMKSLFLLKEFPTNKHTILKRSFANAS